MMMMYVFFRISPVKRLIMVLVFVGTSIAVVGMLPESVRSRLTKVATDGGEDLGS